MTSPLVSVIVPVYNRAHYLGDAVASALGQVDANVEVLVVNDGSSDDTGQVADALAAADPRVRVFHQPNGGVSAARNTGIRAARGTYICFLDSDDAFLPDKVRLQTAYLEAHPECDLVYSDIVYANDALEPVRPRKRRAPPVPLADMLVYSNWFAPHAPMLRASLVRAVGEFDESLRASEDWDYWIRCAAHGRIDYLPGAVALYRLHGAQLHAQVDLMQRSEMQVIAKHYRHDPPRYRTALGARHLDYARNYYGRRHPLRTLRAYVTMALVMRDPRAIHRVIRHTADPVEGNHP